MYTLPPGSRLAPQARILVSDNWAADSATSAGAWEVLPAPTTLRAGYELLSCSRYALPQIGLARFRFVFGEFANGIVGASSPGVWSSSSTIQARDLRDHYIRIQVRDDPLEEVESSPREWRTVWIGICEHYEEERHAAGPLPAGDRVYHCTDLLQVMRKWRMGRHGLHSTGPDSIDAQIPTNGAVSEGIIGHPGYNISTNGGIAGNRATDAGSYYTRFSVNVKKHCESGAANAVRWTDLEVVRNAIDSSRPYQNPVFGITDTATALTGPASVWPVSEGMPTIDFINTILDRRRGRGNAALTWADDSADPTGPITVGITVFPQTYEDIVVTKPTGGTLTITGAAAAGTVYDNGDTFLDIIGDHRIVSGKTKITGRFINNVDYLETVGEQIEVAITGSVGDGGTTAAPYTAHALHPAWSLGQATAFAAATNPESPKWDAVYQSYRLPMAWEGKASNGNGAAAIRVDYRTSASGAIEIPTGNPDTSPVLCEILSDLPFLEGYDYTSSPAVAVDAETAQGDQQRRRPLVLIRTASDTYDLCGKDGEPVEVRPDGHRLFVSFSNDEPGDRTTVGSVSALGSANDFTALVVTFAIRLPHRVRFASGSESVGGTSMRIEIPNNHLWLAAPNCIWTHSAAGAVRGALGSTTTPAIIRDDRDALAVLHALAWQWYGSPAQVGGQTRQTMTYTIRDCGLLGSFSAYRHDPPGPPEVGATVTAIPYPTLGQMVSQMQFGGEIVPIYTPITGIEYDHQEWETTFVTDWQDLDYVR
jgi:hypothetical protein